MSNILGCAAARDDACGGGDSQTLKIYANHLYQSDHLCQLPTVSFYRPTTIPTGQQPTVSKHRKCEHTISNKVVC